MKHILLCLMYLILSTELMASERILHVVFVRTAETDGSKASTATAQSFKASIDIANQIYATAGIQFKFDPNVDFPPIVNDTLLHHDFMLAKNQSLNQPKDKEPQVDGSLHALAKNNFVRNKYWGKLVVFSGIGDQLSFNDSLGHWEINPRTYAYSNMIDLFVQWFNSDASPNVFAHEVGHYLHLGHTHGYLPKDVKEFKDLVTKGITQWGYTNSNIGQLFDGDIGSVVDTPPDPGPDLWKAVTGDPCSAGNQISIPVTVGTNSFAVIFNTDRRNIMSYFKECPFADGHHISAEQAQRSRESLDFGNRQPLINLNPGFLIPQWSPDIKAVSWAPGRLDLFVTGVDLKTEHKAYDSSQGWVPALQYNAEQWDNMGGKIIGKPTAVAWGPNRLDVFVRGLDNKMYHKAWAASAWYPGSGVSDWESLGGSFAGNPVAVSWESERLDIFGRGFDGHLYHKWWTPSSGWAPAQWEDMGGKLSTDPVVVSWGKNRLDIVMRAYDGTVNHKAFSGDRWYPSVTEWNSLGGSIVGEPAMTTWGSNRLDIVVRGTDNQIYHKAWNGQWYPSESGWTSLGGSVLSKPSMVSWGAGRLDIVAQGADTQLYHKAYQEGTGWFPSLSGWSNIGGWLLKGSAPEIMSWGPGRLDLFIRNTNYQIQHKAWDNQSGWYPGASLWEDLGKYIE